MRTVYVGNHTAAYHGGSWAVCRSIETQAAAAGWAVRWEQDRTTLETDAIADCDAVLVNGEGTLHDDLPRARHLLNLLEHAQRVGLRTGLCNASWANMGSWCHDTVRRLDHVAVREPMSEERMRAECGVTPALHFDLAYYELTPVPSVERDVRLLCTDFYSREFDAFVFVNGGRFLGLPRLDMRTSDWAQTLEAVARTRVLVCGRFHGLVAACRTRTRFVVASGNTHKVDGVLRWFDERSPLGLVTNPRRLVAEAVASHRIGARYEAFFDWVQSLPPWRFPFD